MMVKVLPEMPVSPVGVPKFLPNVRPGEEQVMTAQVVGPDSAAGSLPAQTCPWLLQAFRE